MLSSLLLLAQQATTTPAVVEAKPDPYSPDWWFDKFDKYGFNGILSFMVLFFIWKYGPRVLEAFIAYLQTSREATEKNSLAIDQTSETLKKLTEMKERQQEQLTLMVESQEKTGDSASALMSLDKHEKRLARALDLVDLAFANIAPQAAREAKEHTDAVRYMSHSR